MREKNINNTSFILKIKWEIYLKKIGYFLKNIFINDFEKRIMLSKVLDYIIKKELNSAYKELKSIKEYFISNEEKEVYHRLTVICFNETEMTKVKEKDWIKNCNSGYYYVVKINDGIAIIKEAFDHDKNYVLESKRNDGYKIMITNLKTYQFLNKKEKRFINNHFNDNKIKKFLQNTDKMLLFRDELLKVGFSEALYDCRQFNFYKKLKDKVAFIINLKDYGDYIKVLFGFASYVDDEYFKKYGEDFENIEFRFQYILRDYNDELRLKKIIKNIYDEYFNINKDELLYLKRNRQKIFLKNINEKLKPLGFIKNNVKWQKKLEEGYYLEFYAEKSEWNDVYYFNFKIYNLNNICYSRRTDIIVDWQILSKIECDILMDLIRKEIIEPIINTPLDKLFKNKDILAYSYCNKKKCSNCLFK